MYVVGVTGGIGSGKSTVSKIMEEKGAYVFDADSVAKHLLSTNEQLRQDLIDEFQDDIIDDEGKIVNEKLARTGFSNKLNQEALNGIVHPYVLEAHEKAVDEIRQKESTDLYILDAPLLFESGFDQRTDYTLLVYAHMKIRLNRSLKRGNLSRNEILRRMDLQMPEEEKLELADFVIENNGTEDELREATLKVFSQITG